MAKAWYIYNGGDQLQASNYFRNDGVVSICLCGSEIGAIYAEEKEGYKHPVEPLSTNMQRYIKDALVTGQLQPDTPYYAKKYVYLMD